MLPTARQLQHQATHQAAIAAAAQKRQAAVDAKAAAAQARQTAKENARQAALTRKQAEVDARQQRRQSQWAAHHPAAAAYQAGQTSGNPSAAPLAPITDPTPGAQAAAATGAAADPYAGFSGSSTTAGDQGAAATPAGKSSGIGGVWAGMSTVEKVGIVAGGVVALGGLYAYSKYRKLTAPVRHVQRIVKAVQG